MDRVPIPLVHEDNDNTMAVGAVLAWTGSGCPGWSWLAVLAQAISDSFAVLGTSFDITVVIGHSSGR